MSKSASENTQSQKGPGRLPPLPVRSPQADPRLIPQKEVRGSTRLHMHWILAAYARPPESQIGVPWTLGNETE